MTKAELIALARTLVPADLMSDVERSLAVPQVGEYHCEGPFMDSHLSLVLSALTNVTDGKIDERIPAQVRTLMTDALQALGQQAAPLYVLLHDLDKATCMTLVYADGRKVPVTWEEWTSMFQGETGEELVAFCDDSQITQISYYQAGDKKTGRAGRMHGPVAAGRLSGRDDIPEIVVMAIGQHEKSFTFGTRGGVNIPLIEKLFSGKSDVEIGFVFAVNYADQMGSHRPSGAADLSNLVLMAQSYVARAQHEELSERLAQTDRLNGQKVNKTLAALHDATDAFQNEDVDGAYERILEECGLAQVTAEQVLEVLQPAIAEGLSQDLASRIAAEVAETGAPSSETGKAVGRFNRQVRPALAELLG